MNTRENNRMNTFTTVDVVLRAHQESIATIEALNRAVQKFRATLADVQKLNYSYTTATTGATASKNSAAETIISHILKVSNALYVYGKTTGNEQLKTECRIKPSDFAHPRDIELQRQCDRTIELAQAHGDDLVAYGISAADIESLISELAVYRKQREEQQLKIAESKAAREMLYASFDEAADILKEEIDPLMQLFETADVEFYNHYKAARVIKDRGRHAAKKNTSDTSGHNSPEAATAASTAMV